MQNLCKNEKQKEIGQNRPDGFSLIELIIVILVLGIISMIAIPNLLSARRAANEAASLSNTRMIFSAQNAFKISSPTRDFGSFAQLQGMGLVDSTIGPLPATKSGFYFEMDVYVRTTNTQARFDLRTKPVRHSLVQPLNGTGSRDFGTSEGAVIYQTTDNTSVTFDLVTREVQGTAIPIGN